MNFRELINSVFFKKIPTKPFINPFIIESLDSFYPILKTEKDQNIIKHYVNIGEEQYFIFIETIKEEGIHLHIGFEWFNGVKYTTEGVHNKLNNKEVLGLFGTIYKIIKSLKFNSISVKTRDLGKYGLYTRLMSKLAKEINFISYSSNDEYIFIYDEEGHIPSKKILTYFKK